MLMEATSHISWRWEKGMECDILINFPSDLCAPNLDFFLMLFKELRLIGVQIPVEDWTIMCVCVCV